jgi:SAM-dependent methyltransferase
MDLAKRAGIGAGMLGIDLCCCSGAGMRFLVKFCNVAAMRGVDATIKVVERGRQRCQAAGLDQKIKFTLADVCANGLPSASADFIWGEDAWCYVVDKPALIAAAARLVKPGGTIAFTDWVEGAAGLDDRQAERFLRFMKFPNIQDLSGYRQLLADNGCEVVLAEHTGRFAPYVDLYLNMLNMQLTYDALKIIGFDTDLMGAMAAEMQFMQQLAHEGRIEQGLIVARKK